MSKLIFSDLVFSSLVLFLASVSLSNLLKIPGHYRLCLQLDSFTVLWRWGIIIPIKALERCVLVSWPVYLYWLADSGAAQIFFSLFTSAYGHPTVHDWNFHHWQSHSQPVTNFEHLSSQNSLLYIGWASMSIYAGLSTMVSSSLKKKQEETKCTWNEI